MEYLCQSAWLSLALMKSLHTFSHSLDRWNFHHMTFLLLGLSNWTTGFVCLYDCLIQLLHLVLCHSLEFSFQIGVKFFPIHVARIYPAGGCSFKPLSFKINNSMWHLVIIKKHLDSDCFLETLQLRIRSIKHRLPKVMSNTSCLALVTNVLPTLKLLRLD